MRVRSVCRDREASQVAPQQRWAGVQPTRAGIANMLANHAAHARARMQNEACAHSALCRREEVAVEERQVDLGLTSALGALGMVLCTRESE